jgi:hypothetical protein
MSDCDIAHGLSVAGFVTAIVPNFAAPPADQPPGAGGARRRLGADRLAAPSRDGVVVITFDEEGVRGA